MKIVPLFADKSLIWIEAKGIGYLEHPSIDYDSDYFSHYRQLAKTDIGLALNEARIGLVNKFTKGIVIDVGVGGCNFVEGRNLTLGYDINPHAVKYLKSRYLYGNPTEMSVEALTFWDSLEHIKDPTPLLALVQKFVFISCPIYDGMNHVLRSKHFKPGEHYWYWTPKGIENFMAAFGFELVEQNRMESEIGRDGIGTFVFKRVATKGGVPSVTTDK